MGKLSKNGVETVEANTTCTFHRLNLKRCNFHHGTAQQVAPFAARGLIQSCPPDLKTPQEWCRFAVARGEKGRGGWKTQVHRPRKGGKQDGIICRQKMGLIWKPCLGRGHHDGVRSSGAWHVFFCGCKDPSQCWLKMMKNCTCFGSKRAWSAAFLGYETIFSDCLRSQILRNSTLGSRLKHWDLYRLSHLHPTDFPVDCHLHVNSLSTGFEGSSSLDDPLPTRNPCCNFVGQTYAVPRSSQISFFKMNMAYPRHLAKKWCFSAWLVELCIQIDCTRSKVPLILQSPVR